VSVPDPAAVPLPPDADGVASLPDDPATLKRMVLELLASLHQARHDNEALRHRLDLLLRRLYGPRGERIDPRQGLLFPEPAVAAAAAAEPVPRRRCRPHGRRRLPQDLPREARHHQLPEAERLCPACGQLRIDIGVDRSEQLEYRPASLFVIEHLVHKYACPCGRGGPAAAAGPAPAVPPAGAGAGPGPLPAGQPQPAAAEAPPGRPAEPAAGPAATPADPAAVVVAAAKPAMPIAKGMPGPGLLAHLIVSKYTDHLPLHRLERIYERQGVFLHRSTLSDWLASCAGLLRPVYELMVQAALRSRALHTDDTPVKMQDPVSHLLQTARLWAYLGDSGRPYNVFDFTLNRKRDGPALFLAEYQGYLHADAFSGYDGLYLPDPRAARARIIEVACNAHARRKFYEARGTDAARAHQALAYYRQLYELERAAKDFSEEQRLQMRRDLAVPLLGQFHTWLSAQRGEVLPKSPMAEAIGYALNNWAALARYTEAGFLAIDNNAAEREMKRIAIGRKNWLSVGSPRGGQTAAVLISFTSTCARLGVEPWSYLQDVLTRLPGLPAAQRPELLPDRWQAARRARQTSAAGSPPAPSAESPS
jgi:transposase